MRARDDEIATLFDRHYREMRSLAFALLGDLGQAEEVASDVFVKAFSGWGRFRSLDHPQSYLRRMTVNECRGRIRRQRLELRVNEVTQRRERDEVSDAQRDLDLLAAVRTLPERQRACVVLRYLEDLSEQETADLLGISVGTVKSQLAKARASLQPQIERLRDG